MRAYSGRNQTGGRRVSPGATGRVAMDLPPKISVLIPTYNYARYLPEAIESVLAQQDVDCEILISDDASTDGSAGIIRRYAERDPRIRPALHPTNLGMVANWNWCLAHARGEYVKFLFGDDLLATPTALAEFAALLEAHPDAALAASARLLVDEATRLQGVWDDLAPGRHEGPALMLRCLRRRRNLIGEPTAVMFRRAMGTRGFDPALRQIVDQEMWFHLLLSGSLVYTPRPLCAFRRHAAQQTSVNNLTRITDREMLHLLARYVPLLQRWLPPRGFAHRRILFRQWHYMRRAREIGATPDATVLAELRRQLPFPWLAACWVCHRVTRPLENLGRKISQWTRFLRHSFGLAAARRGPRAAHAWFGVRPQLAPGSDSPLNFNPPAGHRGPSPS
jgi:glycosyltransferase involved in cell wall biosynthesis